MKLNYTFINPNPIDSTAELLLKTFVESNHFKVEKAIKSNIERTDKLTEIAV